MARRSVTHMHPAVDVAPPGAVVQSDKEAGTRSGFNALLESATQEILAVTYWFDPTPHPEPYPVTVRFAGRRVDVRGRLSPGDRFVQTRRSRKSCLGAARSHSPPVSAASMRASGP